jgi:hypothetical protein
MAKLVVVRGENQGASIALDRGSMVLGRRSDCEIVLSHKAAARCHARIVREGDDYYLEDLNSRNGTWLNGARIHGRVPLRQGDRIRIAEHELVFDSPEPSAAELHVPALDRDTELRETETVIEAEPPRTGGGPGRGWQTAAAELRAARQRQRATWGDLDDALLGRCLAGEASPAELRQFETALGQHPALAELADLVRGALAGEPRGELGRNLLFGVLALQLDLIDEGQLTEACAGWAARKDQGLADLLARRGWLGPVDRADVERFLSRELRKAGGNVRTALAACAGEPARRALAAVSDPELRRFVHEALRQPGGNPPPRPGGGASAP